MSLIAPEVDPAQAPKNIIIKGAHFENEGQTSKFAVANPVVVPMDPT